MKKTSIKVFMVVTTIQEMSISLESTVEEVIIVEEVTLNTAAEEVTPKAKKAAITTEKVQKLL